MESLRLIGLTIGMAVVFGCGSSQVPYSVARPPLAETASTLKASSALERTVLERMGDLSPGQTLKSMDGTAIVERVYLAANGRQCRTVHLRLATQPSVDRLACHDGERWFFVPTLDAKVLATADVATANTRQSVTLVSSHEASQ